jgi:hypothetical protein
MASPTTESLFAKLREQNFQIECHAHAEAILSFEFRESMVLLEQALQSFSIPIHEIIAGGGGEAKGTQRLRRALDRLGWKKTTFTVEKRINDVPRESQSHEVDHVLTFPGGTTLALEIEWNNKDPFFDRDLENFKRLHADGAISVGFIVTRGAEPHDGLRELVRRFCEEMAISGFDDLRRWGVSPTARQRVEIMKRVTRTKEPLSFRDAFADHFTSDKFGEATTHWRKLEDRVRRGVGNPCPLVLIGLPLSTVTFEELNT